MKQLLIIVIAFCMLNINLKAQVDYTANEIVPPYTGTFGYGTNMGYNPPWTDEQLADIAAGNPDLNVEGVAANSIRPALFEHFLEYYGYDIRLNAFQHYSKLGMKDNVCFIGYPSDEHKDDVKYCDNNHVEMFDNIYKDIWDDGENGTPVNDENHYALYLYKMVTLYKDYVKFWEVWNEPDLDLMGNGWKPRGMEGNWWENTPKPCEYALRAPIHSYVRLLRISYEVIKSVDPEAFVCIGGLGYPSFLDAVLRSTDNPAEGEVSECYPLLGGAYFDVMSYHSYPHIDGSLRTWNNEQGGFDYTRHSDAAVDGVINNRNRFREVLHNYGYKGGDHFPEKHFIITECNIPRKQFGDHIGSDDAQVNFIIKSLVRCQKENILQFHIYNLGEASPQDANLTEFNFMGLYEALTQTPPYQQRLTAGGVAFQNTATLLKEYQYDPNQTRLMDLPDDVGGGAFVDKQGKYQYVLWAKTFIDQSEEAKADYSFPLSFGMNQLEKRLWNFTQTKVRKIIRPTDIQLTGTPIFISPRNYDSGHLDTDFNPFEIAISPNPFVKTTSIDFTLDEATEVTLEIYNQQGALIHTLLKDEPLGVGKHEVPYAPDFVSAGMLFCLFRTRKYTRSFKLAQIQM